MRLFSHIYSFPHPWNIITLASWQKYPNKEFTPHVTNVDYLSRYLDAEGRLVTERLLRCQQTIPSFVGRLLGSVKDNGLVYERCIVDPKGQSMVLVTRNLSFSHLMVVEERCEYTPESESSTRLKQDCRVKSFHGWTWLTEHIEDFCVNRFQVNAVKGRRALEEAVEQIERVCIDSLDKLWCDGPFTVPSVSTGRDAAPDNVNNTTK